ncbi:hypothetical protein FBU59_001839 [Linderina macrospora]|uniref:Uncharacterized protein n=1 Tax=Linderina macrospora TaxID=4868 RepID=A0ACC1JCW9_9FUNG|nr:hypothetical protein FBU59_001839 [Linderina macrospora]
MCTSLVRVTPALLDFGPVDVGTLKSLDLVIENQSAVAAAIQCQVDSKVITCNRAPLTVPALQSVRVRVDIYPRRVNARYRKQIVVRNLHNRRNDSVVEVRSEHVDRRRMAYHNLFYRTLVPDNEQNFVDFGTIPLNSRVLRRVNLHSRCPRPMTIQLAAGDDGGGVVSLYTTVDPRALASAEVRDAARRLPLLERQAEIHSSIERFKERAEVPQDTAGAAAVPRRRPTESLASSVLQRDMFVDKRVQRGHTCLVPFPRTMRAAHPSIDYLDIATRDPPIRPPMTVRIRRRRLHDGGIGHVSEPAHAEPPAVAETVARIMERAARILDEIVNGLDTTPCTLFATAKAEDEYVRRQVDLHKYVDLLIESGYLKPAQSVTLPASGSAPVFVMVRAMESLLEPHADPSSSSVPPRLDANVYMKLVERPVDLLDTAAELPEGMAQLPERRFLVRASFCRSDLGLGQKSINVGNMQVDESSRKYLLIQNRAETPLMYAIRKTGSIASGDIRFVDSNRYGVVRGFDSRKIVFVFRPSLTGAYNEQISIANVLNAHGGKTATLKAVVRRPSKFYIQSLALSFPSPLSVDQRSDEFQALVLKNMTPKTRILVVRPIDPPPSDTPISVLLAPVFPADIADAAAPPPRLLDRETEEKIEALEQKLKIAVRKNRPEKIDKYHKKLAKLRGSAHAPADAQDTLPDGASSPGTNDKAVVVARADGDSHLVVTLPASADVSIPVVAVPHILEDGVSGVIAAQGFLVVHEQKDKDNIKVVTLSASVQID